MQRGQWASPTPFRQGAMHTANYRGRCTHKGGYCQSPKALCPSSVLGQPGPDGHKVGLPPGAPGGLVKFWRLEEITWA